MREANKQACELKRAVLWYMKIYYGALVVL